jgi:hypothetical protein
MVYCRVVLLSTAICFSHTQFCNLYVTCHSNALPFITFREEEREISRYDGAETCSEHDKLMTYLLTLFCTTAGFIRDCVV